jgi:hypothetical protein
MPYIKRGRSDAMNLAPTSLAAATGWLALMKGGSGEALHVVAWGLMPDGEVIGIVDDGGQFVSAEQLSNFSGFRHKV